MGGFFNLFYLFFVIFFLKKFHFFSFFLNLGTVDLDMGQAKESGDDPVEKDLEPDPLEDPRQGSCDLSAARIPKGGSP